MAGVARRRSQLQGGCDAERRQDFDKFRAERGPLLSRFACFEVLRHKFRQAVVGMAGAMAAAGRRQMRRPAQRARMPPKSSSSNSCNGPPTGSSVCRDLARKLGMKVGLYLDVAVGVQSDGFDAWNEQAAISRHLAVGAPPDPLNTAGQNWGLAGFNAAGLEDTVVRAVSRHAARLDAPCRRDPARPCARA